jgi:hypothetical protein
LYIFLKIFPTISSASSSAALTLTSRPSVVRHLPPRCPHDTIRARSTRTPSTCARSPRARSTLKPPCLFHPRSSKTGQLTPQCPHDTLHARSTRTRSPCACSTHAHSTRPRSTSPQATRVCSNRARPKLDNCLRTVHNILSTSFHPHSCHLRSFSPRSFRPRLLLVPPAPLHLLPDTLLYHALSRQPQFHRPSIGYSPKNSPSPSLPFPSSTRPPLLR